MDERNDFVAVLITENPISLFSEILKVDDFVGVNESNDVFKHLLMQEEIGRPEVKRTKPNCGHFGAPVVERITELGGAQCQNMQRPFAFGKV